MLRHIKQQGGIEMAKIEKIIGVAILVLLVLFVGSCTVALNAVSECQGLQGVVEAVWEGKDCGAGA
jgi:hypothetical protein